MKRKGGNGGEGTKGKREVLGLQFLQVQRRKKVERKRS